MCVSEALYVVEDEPGQGDDHEDDEGDGDEQHGGLVDGVVVLGVPAVVGAHCDVHHDLGAIVH